MNKFRTAKSISTFTNPPIICIPLFLIISTVLSFDNGIFNIGKFILLESISIVFASVLPMAIIVYWAKKLKTDGDISNREDRFVPLIVGVISYFIGFLVSLILNADMFLTLLMLCYSTNTFIVMLITLKWKISIHTTGLSGPVGALILLLGPLGAILGIIYPILIWSRVLLKKHTMAQAICGGVMGFYLTVIEMNLFNIMNINMLNLELSCLYVLSIVITPVILGFLTYININNKKRAFILSEAISAVFFLIFSPSSVFAVFVLVTISSIAVSYFDCDEFPWFKILKSS